MTTTTVSPRNEKRAWLAALLAFLSPGLGHVYLRQWLRSLTWFFLYVASFTLLVPESAMAEEVSLAAYSEMMDAVPLESKLALASIVFFATLDAYWMAKRGNREQAVEDGTTCPHCGKDVDPDLAFCHWCTEQLPAAESENETESESENPDPKADA